MHGMRWIGLMLGTGLGAWWWNWRQRAVLRRERRSRGTVIFDNTPHASAQRGV